MSKYLVISDIHANYDALEAVLKAEPDLPIWFLGDAIGYYYDAIRVLNKLVQLEEEQRLEVWLQGNHDHAISELNDIVLIGMQEVAVAAIKQTRELLRETKYAPLHERLCHLHPTEARRIGDLDIFFSHGGPDAPLNHYVENIADAYDAAQDCPAPLCLLGHTHVPRHFFSIQANQRDSWEEQWLPPQTLQRYNWQTNTGGCTILNPGSVGQPRDGANGSFAVYAILDCSDHTFSICRVPYNPEPLQKATLLWLQAYLPETALDWHINRLNTNR